MDGSNVQFIARVVQGTDDGRYRSNSRTAAVSFEIQMWDKVKHTMEPLVSVRPKSLHQALFFADMLNAMAPDMRAKFLALFVDQQEIEG